MIVLYPDAGFVQNCAKNQSGTNSCHFMVTLVAQSNFSAMTTLHIKNMVCDRCIATAQRLLREEGYRVQDVSLGKAVVGNLPHEVNMDRLAWQLRELGFDLIFDRDEQLVIRIKASILEYLKLCEDAGERRKLSAFLSDVLEIGYSSLSRTFSEVSGDTIEQYQIRLKIERVKELISYGELNLSQIAWKLGYSSVQHLSRQFRLVTGSTVRDFKEGLSQASEGRKPLDQV